VSWPVCELECCTGLVFQSCSRQFPQAFVPLPSRSREARSRSRPVPVNMGHVPIPIPWPVAEHYMYFFRWGSSAIVVDSLWSNSFQYNLSIIQSCKIMFSNQWHQWGEWSTPAGRQWKFIPLPRENRKTYSRSRCYHGILFKNDPDPVGLLRDFTAPAPVQYSTVSWLIHELSVCELAYPWVV